MIDLRVGGVETSCSKFADRFADRKALEPRADGGTLPDTLRDVLASSRAMSAPSPNQTPRGQQSWRTMNEAELSESLIYLTCPICGEDMKKAHPPCDTLFDGGAWRRERLADEKERERACGQACVCVCACGGEAGRAVLWGGCGQDSGVIGC